MNNNQHFRNIYGSLLSEYKLSEIRGFEEFLKNEFPSYKKVVSRIKAEMRYFRFWKKFDTIIQFKY